MTLHLGDTRGYAGSDGGAHAASLGQQPEPHLIHAGHVAPLGHHAVQEGEVVALGLIQLDEGVVPRTAGSQWLSCTRNTCAGSAA